MRLLYDVLVFWAVTSMAPEASKCASRNKNFLMILGYGVISSKGWEEALMSVLRYF